MALVRVVVISTVRAKRAPTTVGAIPESETEHRGEPADARVRHPLRDVERAGDEAGHDVGTLRTSQLHAESGLVGVEVVPGRQLRG